jgi:hypothetical protein
LHNPRRANQPIIFKYESSAHQRVDFCQR